MNKPSPNNLGSSISSSINNNSSNSAAQFSSSSGPGFNRPPSATSNHSSTISNSHSSSSLVRKFTPYHIKKYNYQCYLNQKNTNIKFQKYFLISDIFKLHYSFSIDIQSSRKIKQKFIIRKSQNNKDYTYYL